MDVRYSFLDVSERPTQTIWTFFLQFFVDVKTPVLALTETLAFTRKNINFVAVELNGVLIPSASP